MIEKYKFLDYPIFITGNATSGTTLLRNLLDGHKDLMVFPVQMGLRAFLDKEGMLYSDFEIDNFFQSGPTTGVNSLHLNKASNDSGDRDYTDINFSELKKRVYSEWDQKTAKDLQNKVIKSFFDYSKYNQVSPKMWVEKTHGNDKYIELFLSWYPAAKIIHIIRDPYDNFSSYRKKMAKNGEAVDAVSFCVEWTLSIDRVLKAYKK